MSPLSGHTLRTTKHGLQSVSTLPITHIPRSDNYYVKVWPFGMSGISRDYCKHALVLNRQSSDSSSSGGSNRCAQ